ncbi:hypothetical protein AVEN_126384-1 [Araneus ventricosus]|uniref:Uncharacterized protein n=1 Tax=Araneus ventricosus TaxID=182803 RepID=A0A4Y2V1S8_ARAVE|nr:hypothetical protein AVEN_126384-1 [Araneus ventricosus]
MAVITRCSIAGSTEVQAACRRATKSICVVTTSRTWGSGSMAATFARSYTVGFFPMGPSQGTGVSRRSDNTNGLSCSSACCLYFCGPAMLQRVMTAIPRRAQACLDMHGGHFEHLL